MKRKLRISLLICLTVVFLGSFGVVMHRNIQFKQSEEAYQEAEELTQKVWEEPIQEAATPLAELPEEPEGWREAPVYDDPNMDEMRSIDLAALREVNPDVVGWIRIPGTQLDYPLMQGEDNQYYLKRTWEKKRNAAGSVFLEQTASPGFDEFNTLIYGHNMKNGTMFSNLRHYRDQEYLDNHPCVYIATDDAILRYEVFSAYTADVSTDTYRLYFEDDGRKQSVIDFYLEQSEVESDLVPTVEDRILTLSTCTGMGDYDYRLVVQAVLTGQFSR